MSNNWHNGNPSGGQNARRENFTSYKECPTHRWGTKTCCLKGQPSTCPGDSGTCGPCDGAYCHCPHPNNIPGDARECLYDTSGDYSHELCPTPAGANDGGAEYPCPESGNCRDNVYPPLGSQMLQAMSNSNSNSKTYKECPSHKWGTKSCCLKGQPSTCPGDSGTCGPCDGAYCHCPDVVKPTIPGLNVGCLYNAASTDGHAAGGGELCKTPAGTSYVGGERPCPQSLRCNDLHYFAQ